MSCQRDGVRGSTSYPLRQNKGNYALLGSTPSNSYGITGDQTHILLTIEPTLEGFHTYFFRTENQKFQIWTLMCSKQMDVEWKFNPCPFTNPVALCSIRRWVHVVCALYVPGVAFGDIDKLRPVTLTEMNYTKYGAKVRRRRLIGINIRLYLYFAILRWLFEVELKYYSYDVT